MHFEVKIPPVGESITEVTISSWKKNNGDFVEQDEIICEVDSDKTSFEIPAEKAGKLNILKQEDETVEVGTIVCTIDTESTNNTPSSQSENKNEDHEESDSPDEVHKTGEIIEIVVPEVGESITEVTIAEWTKENGSFVEKDEIICEIDSDKATFELPSDATGILQIIAQSGDTVKVGDVVCKIEVGSSTSKPKESQSSSSKTAPETKRSNESYVKGHPSPAANKILNEKGISPSEVKGSGVDGRITKEDALKASKSQKEEKKGVSEETGDNNRSSRREKITNLRKTISKRLVSVKNETAMLTTFNEVNMKPIMDVRKKYKDQFKEKYEVGLGFMSFFTKACCIALKEWPAVNAYLDENEIEYHDYCDISIAVSTPKGLVVPVIRNAEKLSFQGIESEIIRLAGKARDGKLTIPEMTGGTFTITNGGVFGSMMSTPIINPPQSAILGMHNIVQRPFAENGEVVIRPIMFVALSYDHRIIDGRESVSFLVRVKQLLEDPMRLLLNV